MQMMQNQIWIVMSCCVAEELHGADNSSCIGLTQKMREARFIVDEAVARSREKTMNKSFGPQSWGKILRRAVRLASYTNSGSLN